MGFKRPERTPEKMEEARDSVYLEVPGETTTRGSNHKASMEFFVDNKTPDNLSVVVRKPNNWKPFNADSRVNGVEAVFERRQLHNNPNMMAHILRDIAEFAATGEYHDTAGAADYNFSGNAAYVAHALDRVYGDALARGDTETAQKMVLEAAERLMPGAKKVRVDWRAEPDPKLAPYKVSSLPHEAAQIVAGWKSISKSPYSDSFYNAKNITWKNKPDRSLRLSNHWNFGSAYDQKTHCETDRPIENERKWALAEYHKEDGKYHILKEWDAVGEWSGRIYNPRTMSGGMISPQTQTMRQISQANSLARKNGKSETYVLFDPFAPSEMVSRPEKSRVPVRLVLL